MIILWRNLVKTFFLSYFRRLTFDKRANTCLGKGVIWKSKVEPAAEKAEKHQLNNHAMCGYSHIFNEVRLKAYFK